MADKREQIADALRGMGYRPSEAKAAAAKLEDLSRPLDKLLRDALRYAAGETPKRENMDPMSKLHRNGKTTIETGKAKVEGFFARLQRKWRPEDTRLAIAASGGAFAALTLAWGASKIFGDKPAAGPTVGAAPPSPSPSTATAPAGATLIVTTKKKGQPGMLRSAPGKSSAMVQTVPAGTMVKVEDSATVDKDRWYRVQLPSGKVGWMHGGILS